MFFYERFINLIKAENALKEYKDAIKIWTIVEKTKNDREQITDYINNLEKLEKHHKLLDPPGSFKHLLDYDEDISTKLDKIKQAKEGFEKYHYTNCLKDIEYCEDIDDFLYRELSNYMELTDDRLAKSEIHIYWHYPSNDNSYFWINFEDHVDFDQVKKKWTTKNIDIIKKLDNRQTKFFKTKLDIMPDRMKIILYFIHK